MRPEKILAGLLVGSVVVAVIAVIVTIGSILNGLALSIIWNWFMPRLFGLPALSIGSAIVVCLVANYILYVPADKNQKSGEALVLVLVRPAFAVGFAWIMTHFV